MTSPGFKPALSAAESLVTCAMSAPLASESLNCSASSLVTFWMETPSTPRLICLPLSRVGSMSLIMFAGMAGMDGRIGLQKILIVRDADIRASLGADNAGGHRLCQTERRTDCHHQ